MLRARILTSLLLIPSFLAALFYLSDFIWLLFCLAIITIASWEWAGISSFKFKSKILFSLLIFLFGMIASFSAWLGYPKTLKCILFFSLPIAVLFWVVVVPYWLIKKIKVSNAFIMAFIGFILLVSTWSALVVLRENELLKLVGLENKNSLLLLVILGTVWIADSAAYFSGKMFGKNKLAPEISPGKTWEGVFGAFVFVSIYGLFLCYMFGIPYSILFLFWTVTVISVVGDLFESLLKRNANLKDSGSLLPGHGGVLDRIDGLISSLPLAAFIIYFPVYYVVISQNA